MKKSKLLSVVSFVLCLMILLNLGTGISFAAETLEKTVLVENMGEYESYQGTQNLSSLVDVDEFKSVMLEGLNAHNESIDVSAFDITANTWNMDVLREYIFKEISLSFLFENYSYSYNVVTGKLKYIQPNYKYSASESQVIISQVNAVKDKLLTGIKDNASLSDAEKALLIHDRLALRCEYDFSFGADMGSVYGALVNGVVVCEGYTKAYDFLLEEVGIESYYCGSAELNHAWNIVFIDGVSYHVDVTWDDYAWDNYERGAVGIVAHDNFLRSTAGIKATGHSASDFETLPNNTKYDDYFWQDSLTAFQLVGDELYYIDNNTEELKRYSDHATLCDVSDDWLGKLGYWGNWSCLSSGNGDLYYSLSKGVYKYDIASGTSSKIYEPELGTYESIYGFEYYDNYLICDVNVAPPYGPYSPEELYQLKVPYPHENIPTITSIAVSGMPTKTTYNIGDALSIEGLKIKVTYSDSTTEIVESGFTTSGFDSSTSGVKTITVTYNGKTVTFNVTVVDSTNPTVSVTSTNNVAAKQTVTLTMSDNVGVVSYYWGTSASPAESAFTTITSTASKTVTKDVSGSGTYYFIAKDAAGNTASTSIKFCKTTLNANGGSVTPTSIIIKSGEYIDLPTATRDGYGFYGWSTSSSAEDGVTTIRVSENETYYAIWGDMPEISFHKNVSLIEGGTYNAEMKAPSDAQPIIWNSSDSSVVTVSDGVITAKSIGTAVITGEYHYNGIKYKETYYVTVYAKTVLSIELTTKPTKLTYLEDKDELDTSGGKLTITYNDLTTEVIDLTLDMVTGFDNTLAVKKVLTVTYGGKSTTYDVKIVPRSLESIAVTTEPTKLTYLEGTDKLNTAGGKVTFSYNNDTTEVIDLTSDMVTGFDNTKVGKQTLTVTYDGKTATFDVEVIAKSLDSIEITTYPTKVTYLEEKDELDTTGGKVTLSFNNGTATEVVDLTSDMVTGFDNTKVGKQTLTITYDGKAVIFDVIVVAKSLESIEVTTNPTKLTYLEEKDELDTAGGKVTLSFNNGTKEVVDLTSDMVTGFDNTKIGKQTLIVTYEDEKATYNIEVIEKSLESIAVTTEPTKLTYLEEKGVLFTDGGKLTLVYNNGTTDIVNIISEMLTEYDVTVAEAQILTVEYGGMSTSFEATILYVPEGVTVLLGDVNGDGKVNVKDATLIQKAAASLVTLDDAANACADVNSDGKVNVKDATAIQKFAAGLETGFAIGTEIKVKKDSVS